MPCRILESKSSRRFNKSSTRLSACLGLSDLAGPRSDNPADNLSRARGDHSRTRMRREIPISKRTRDHARLRLQHRHTQNTRPAQHDKRSDAARATRYTYIHTQPSARSPEARGRAHRPVSHDTDRLVFPVGALRTRLDDLVEPLEAETPISARRTVAPNIPCEVDKEVVLGAFEASILRDSVEERRVLQHQRVMQPCKNDLRFCVGPQA